MPTPTEPLKWKYHLDRIGVGLPVPNDLLHKEQTHHRNRRQAASETSQALRESAKKTRRDFSIHLPEMRWKFHFSSEYAPFLRHYEYQACASDRNTKTAVHQCRLRPIPNGYH